MSPRASLAALAMISVLAAPAAVQGGDLVDILVNLYGKGGILVGGAKPQAFQESSLLALGTLTRSFQPAGAEQFGVSSTSGAFTYRFDPELGMIVPSTESFGPIVGLRAETLGRNKLALTASWGRVKFTGLDGVDLDGGRLHQAFIDPDTGNTISSRISADLVSNAFIFDASYGVTDDLDIGILVPLLYIDATFTGTAQTNQPGVVFADGSTVLKARSNEKVFGVGDILLRSKWNFARGTIGSVALGFDLSLPSGDSDNFLGVGTVRGHPYFVASSRAWFEVAGHVAFGFRLGDTSKIENSFFYNVGFDWATTRWLTFAFDLLGEHVIDNKRPAPNQGLEALLSNDLTIAGDNILTAAIGFKANPWRTMIMFANVLVPVNSTGLRGIIPSVGIQYTFF